MSSFPQNQLDELQLIFAREFLKFQESSAMALMVQKTRADLDSIMGDGKTLVTALEAKQAEVTAQLQQASQQMQEAQQSHLEHDRKDKEMRAQLDGKFAELQAVNGLENAAAAQRPPTSGWCS